MYYNRGWRNHVCYGRKEQKLGIRESRRNRITRMFGL